MYQPTSHSIAFRPFMMYNKPMQNEPLDLNHRKDVTEYEEDFIIRFMPRDDPHLGGERGERQRGGR